MTDTEVREAAHVRNVVGALEGRRAPPDARSLIIESWKRCAAQFRLDPSVRAETRILTRRELVEFRDPMAPLIRIARPILEDLYRTLEPAGYCILFTDLNGVAIDYLTPASLDDEHRSAGLILGSVWSEAAEGTNGVGTCIVSGRPLTVHRSDHFRSKNAGLSCTCAPVLDPEGRLAAVLDVSTASPDRAGATRYVEHLVEATSRRLANAWFRERHRDRWVLRLFPDAESLDPAREGLVAMEADGTVAAVSAAARRLLAPEGDGAEGPAHGAALSRRLAAFLKAGGEPRLLAGPRPLYLIPVAPAKRPGPRAATDPARPAVPGAPAAPSSSASAAAAAETSPSARAAGADAPGPSRSPAAATRRRPHPDMPADGDPRVAEAERLARLALAGGVPLVVSGESGSGKTAFVRRLGAVDDGRGGPLVELDLAGCDAGTAERLLAEAFGEAGILVLDEVGELAEDARHALLRLLKRREAGGPAPVALVSTSRLPPAALHALLRPDLYFRLAGAAVALPPLRERRDFAAVAAAMLEGAAADLGRDPPALSSGALEALAAAPWPGNLRELRGVLRLALIAAGAAPSLEPEHLRLASAALSSPPAFADGGEGPERGIAAAAWNGGGRRAGAAATADPGFAAPDRARPAAARDPFATIAGTPAGRLARGEAPPAGGPIVDQAVDDLERLLVAHHWCVSKVARVLAVDRSTVHRRMNRFGLVPPQRRG